MSDSLLLGSYECMGIPRTMFTAPDGSSWGLSRETGDLGDPQVETSVLDSVLLDGQPVTGTGSSNRTLSLALQVWSDTEAGLRAGVTAVKQVVEQSRSFPVQWTPDPTTALEAVKTDNLLDANTASLETDVTGWTPSSCTIVQSTTWSTFGPHSMRMTKTTGGVAMEATSVAFFTVNKPGQSHTITATFHNVTAAAARNCQVEADWYDGTGTLITSDVTHAIVVSGATGTALVTVTAPANATTCQAQITIAATSGSVTTGEQWYADAIGIQEGTDTAFQPGYVSQYQGQGYTVPVTPLPSVMDCYRGTATVDWSILSRKQGFVRLAVTAPALPFMRSTVQEQITVSTTGPLLVANMDSAGTLTSAGVSPATGSTAVTADTVNKTNGTASNKVTYSFPAYWYSLTAAGASQDDISFSTTDLSGYSALSFDLEIGANNAIPAEQYVALVVFDTSGRSRLLNQVQYGLASGYFTGASSNLQTGPHTLTSSLTSYVSQSPGFDITAVNKVRFIEQGNAAIYTGTSVVGVGLPASWWVNYDRLVATVAGGGTGISTPQGALITLPNVKGGVRAPVSVQLHKTGGIHGIVLHRRPVEAPQSYTPLLPYMSDGSTALGVFKQVPALGVYAAGAGVRFNGTHALWLAGAVLAGSGLRTITVTLRFSGGSHSDDVTFTRVCQPSDVVNGLLRVDAPKTLPARAVADPDNTGVGLQYKVTDVANGGTTVQDLLCLDTRGPTLVGTEVFGFPFVWLDAPSPLTGVGGFYIDTATKGSTGSTATSAFDNVALSGGPMSVDPMDSANNEFAVWCNEGTPDVTFAYYACWPAERLTA